MSTERYLKLAVLAAILIIALVYPVVAALVLTSVAAWYLEDFKISEMAFVQKVAQLVQLTPPGLNALITSSTAGLKARLLPSADTPPLALPAPAGARDALSRGNMTGDSSKNGAMRYKIVSGGQTGVDRAALDIAIELGLEYGGWCPKEGWAEDLISPPGLLSRYPKLQPTPLEKTAQRTEWNVRDSDATLILIKGADVTRSKGTELTVAKARERRRRYLILDLQDPDRQGKAIGWLKGLGAIHRLNVAGPRESEAPGIDGEARIFLRELLLRAQ
jgi:hypothetical protein